MGLDIQNVALGTEYGRFKIVEKFVTFFFLRLCGGPCIGNWILDPLCCSEDCHRLEMGMPYESIQQGWRHRACFATHRKICCTPSASKMKNIFLV